MRIGILSDVHLEFGVSEVKPVDHLDVLIIAGDLTDFEFAYTGRTDKFMTNLCKMATRVLYVIGNHEHYQSSFGDTINTIEWYRTKFEGTHKNLTVLENESVTIDGVRFFGTTLWTDFNRLNPVVMEAAKSYMNDYKAIPNLTPAKVAGDHIHATRLIQAFLSDSKHVDDPKVVITHHAPCERSVPPQFRGSDSNAYYYTDLSDIILDAHKLSLWVHGHMHNPSDYFLGDTRIVANPMGYAGYERAFQEPYEIKVVTI